MIKLLSEISVDVHTMANCWEREGLEAKRGKEKEERKGFLDFKK